MLSGKVSLYLVGINKSEPQHCLLGNKLKTDNLKTQNKKGIVGPALYSVALR